LGKICLRGWKSPFEGGFKNSKKEAQPNGLRIPSSLREEEKNTHAGGKEGPPCQGRNYNVHPERSLGGNETWPSEKSVSNRFFEGENENPIKKTLGEGTRNKEGTQGQDVGKKKCQRLEKGSCHKDPRGERSKGGKKNATLVRHEITAGVKKGGGQNADSGRGGGGFWFTLKPYGGAAKITEKRRSGGGSKGGGGPPFSELGEKY